MKLDESEEKLARELLSALKNEGGSLRYFFLQGGVAVHDANDAPDTGKSCPITVFLHLREQGLIDMTQREVTGYPHYANNHKSSVYVISGKGRRSV